MKLPPPNTNRFKVLEALYLKGPMSREEMMKRIIKLSPTAVTMAVRGLVYDTELLSREGYVYSLTPAAKELMDECGQVTEVYVGEITAPRVVNVYDRPAYVPPKRLIRPEAAFWANQGSRHL